MSQNHIDTAREILGSFISMDKITIINGGETRQESVYNGLIALEKEEPDYVLIHDGARPWITLKIINSVFNKIKEKKACIPVIKAQDAVKSIGNNGVISGHLDRAKIYCAQTPQGFNYKEILDAHKMAVSDNLSYIDDSEIYSRYIGPVYTVDGDVANRKITYKHDLEFS